MHMQYQTRRRTSMSASRADSPMIMPLYVAAWVPMNSVPRTCSSPSACSVVVPSAGGQASAEVLEGPVLRA
jgi:hypothetical protein